MWWLPNQLATRMTRPCQKKKLPMILPSRNPSLLHETIVTPATRQGSTTLSH